MVKFPNLAAILVASSLSCGEVTPETPETNQVTELIAEQNASVQIAIDAEPEMTPEQIAVQAEADAWQQVVNATPGIDSRDKVESLWKEPTPAFYAYLALWREHNLGLTPFYVRGLLPDEGASGFEAYKDQAPEYQRFITYSENVIRDTSTDTSINEATRESYLNSRRDQIALAQRISGLIADRENETNNMEKYIAPFFRFEAQVNQSNLVGNEYIRTSADPILGLAIMMKETFPGSPSGVVYTPEMRFAMMLALLQDGYYPNHTLSTGGLDEAEERIECRLNDSDAHCIEIYGRVYNQTKSITVAFPQLIYRTAKDVFRRNSEEFAPEILRIDLEGNLDDADFTSQNIFNVVNDMDVAVQVFAYLNWHNRIRMESSDNFFNNPDNIRAFRALSAYFNHQGATRTTYDKVRQWLIECNFDRDIFVEKLSTENRYTRDVVEIADYLGSDPEIQEYLRQFRPSGSPSR